MWRGAKNCPLAANIWTMFSMCQLWSPSGVSLPQNLKYVCSLYFSTSAELCLLHPLSFILKPRSGLSIWAGFFFSFGIKIECSRKTGRANTYTTTRMQNLVKVLLKLFCESYIIITSINEFHDLIHREWCWLSLPHIPEDVWEKCSNLFPVWFCEVKKYWRALKAFWRSR